MSNIYNWISCDADYLNKQFRKFLLGSDEGTALITYREKGYEVNETKVAFHKKYFEELKKHEDDLPFQLFLVSEFVKKISFDYHSSKSKSKKKKMAEYVIVNEREELSQFFDKAVSSNILVRQFRGNKSNVECFVFSEHLCDLNVASYIPVAWQVFYMPQDFETSFISRLNELQQEVIKEKGVSKE